MECSIISFVKLRKWASTECLESWSERLIFSLFGSKNKMKKLKKVLTKSGLYDIIMNVRLREVRALQRVVS